MTAPSADLRMTALDWVVLVSLGMIWGGSFLFVRIAVHDLPPFTVVFGRVALAATLIFLYTRLRGERLPAEPRLWGAFLVMAAINLVIPFSLIAWGETKIDAGLASILNATTPLFTVILATLFTRDERATPSKTLGVLIGFAGVVVLIGPEALAGLTGSVLGQLAIVAASFSYAVVGLFARRFRGLPSGAVALGILTCGTVLMAPLAALERPWALNPSGEALAAVAALAVFSTTFTYVLMFWLLARRGATNTSLSTFIVPVSGVLLGMAVLGEEPSSTTLLGMAVIFAGLIFVDGRLIDRMLRRGGMALEGSQPSGRPDSAG